MFARIKFFFSLLFETWQEWIRDRGTLMAASLAYFNLTSLGSIVGFGIFISYKIIGKEHTETETIPILKTWFPDQIVRVIKFMLQMGKYQSMEQLTIIAGILMLIATKEYFGTIKDSIQTFWNDRREKTGIKNRLNDHFGDILLSIYVLLIASFFFIARTYLPHPFTNENLDITGIRFYLFKGVKLITEFCLVFTIGVLYFKYIPQVKITFKEVFPGSVMYGVLFIIGHEIMRALALSRANAELAEMMLATLAWFYYANSILLFSAEFSKVYIARKRKINVMELEYD